MNVLLVDFEDSFTLNIAQVLSDLGINCGVINYKDISTVEPPHYSAIVLGPGPGHPREYQDLIFPIIEFAFNSGTYMYGICLGHQLLQNYLGYKLKKSSNIVHGQSIEIELTPKYQNLLDTNLSTTHVQRYNSLCVSSKSGSNEFVLDGEVLMNFDEKYFSCQFHPESVGTSFPKLFFKPLLDFLYNRNDEWKTKSRRSI